MARSTKTLFYLGTHRPKMLTNWRAKGPLFASVSTLRKRKSLYPPATVPWALDSGGFSEITLRGGWTFGPREYVQIIEKLLQGLGAPDFMATQDYMCEDIALKKTGLSLLEHQERTVQSYLDLCDLRPSWPWLPVIQGREVSDYHHCVELYARRGVQLENLPRVGLGSVCRRQATDEIADLAISLGSKIKLHGFGVKIGGLEKMPPNALASCDSLAWSAAARWRAARPSVAANSQDVAEAYRDIVTATIEREDTGPARAHFAHMLKTVGVE